MPRGITWFSSLGSSWGARQGENLRGSAPRRDAEDPDLMGLNDLTYLQGAPTELDGRIGPRAHVRRDTEALPRSFGVDSRFVEPTALATESGERDQPASAIAHERHFC
jgi:hypothetical protein